MHGRKILRFDTTSLYCMHSRHLFNEFDDTVLGMSDRLGLFIECDGLYSMRCWLVSTNRFDVCLVCIRQLFCKRQCDCMYIVLSRVGIVDGCHCVYTL
jgi:hypothetical protein